MRICPTCALPLPSSKRSNAVYCDRKCKAGQKEITQLGICVRDRRLAYALEPRRMREAASKRRARRREAETLQITDRDWRRLQARFRSCCAY